LNEVLFYLVELNEEKHRELIEKKEVEISELNAKLRTQEKAKQNEIIKLHLEVGTLEPAWSKPFFDYFSTQ
jgi:hypothetical protein